MPKYKSDLYQHECRCTRPYAVVFFVHDPLVTLPPNLFRPKDGLIQIKLKKVCTDNPGVFQLLWRRGVKPAASGPPRHSKPTSCSALSGSRSRAAPLLAHLGVCVSVHMWLGPGCGNVKQGCEPVSSHVKWAASYVGLFVCTVLKEWRKGC